MLNSCKKNKKTYYFIISLLVILIFSACPSPSDDDPEPAPPIDTPDGKTYLKIENGTDYAVNVYINDPPLYGNDAPAGTLRQVASKGSEQWELQPTAAGQNGDTLYFEYLIPIGSTTIPFYASNTENIKLKKLEAGNINTQEVPTLDSASTDSAFLLINNSSKDTIWLQQGMYTKNPFGSAVRDINAGQDAVIVLGSGVTSLSDFTLGDTTRRNFPNTTIEKGKVYIFNYTGKRAPALMGLQHFDPAMEENIWKIPTSTTVNRSLFVGVFAPRANTEDGYLLVGNITPKNQYVTDQHIKSAPYFAAIDRDGTVSSERIIPTPNPAPNRLLFRSFLEDSDEYVFFGQARSDDYDKPFIMSTSSKLQFNYYYTGFTSSITSSQSLDGWLLAKSGTGKYGVSCDIYNEVTGDYQILIATVTKPAWNSAQHTELWRSPADKDLAAVDMIYDAANDMYIVVANDYDHSDKVKNSLIYFISASAPQTEKFSPMSSDPGTIYQGIIKAGSDYYVAGSYDNPVARTEGILQKINPATGSAGWSRPELFVPDDTTKNQAVNNAIEDNGSIIMAGYTNGTVSGYNPWICAFDPVTKTKLWEAAYTNYANYEVYSIYANGIGSYILELYDADNLSSVLVSTDLLGRVSGRTLDELPRNTSLVYDVQEFANLGPVNVTITPLSDVSVTPPTLTIVKGQSGNFTVNGTWTEYEWYVDGTKLTAASAAVYSLQTGSLSLGIHTVTAVAKNAAGERRSGSYTVYITN